MTNLTLEKRDHFGRILRDLRSSRNVSGRRLSRNSGIPQSHISKFENGKLSPSREHVQKIASALKLTSGEKSRLKSWHRLLDHDFSPFLVHSDAQVVENQRIILDIEDGTRVLRAYQNYVVPGLLQTKDYMRAIFESAQYSAVKVRENTIKNAIDFRLRRQEIIKDRSRRFLFLIHETALLHNIESAPTMKSQIQHLISLNRSEGISLGLIPARYYWEGELPGSSFDIFDTELTLIEVYGGLLYLWMEDVVARYVRLFDSMWLNAITGIALEAELKGRLSEY